MIASMRGIVIFIMFLVMGSIRVRRKSWTRLSDRTDTVSEIENEFQDYLGQTKKFLRVKKKFFPKYSPHPYM